MGRLVGGERGRTVTKNVATVKCHIYVRYASHQNCDLFFKEFAVFTTNVFSVIVMLAVVVHYNLWWLAEIYLRVNIEQIVIRIKSNDYWCQPMEKNLVYYKQINYRV